MEKDLEKGRQVGGVLWSDSLMNTRIGIPTISGNKSCPTCLIVEVVAAEEEEREFQG